MSSLPGVHRVDAPIRDEVVEIANVKANVPADLVEPDPALGDQSTDEREIYALTRQVDADAGEREHNQNRRNLRASRPRTDQIEGYLASAPSEQWRDAVNWRTGSETAAARRRTPQFQQDTARSPRRRRSSACESRGLGREDTPGIGR